VAIKVYCEHGAFRKELYKLQKDGLIELVTFHYEMNMKKKHQDAKPSNAKIADLQHLTLGEENWTFGEFNGSEKFNQIQNILGEHNRRDVLHVDSAYKTGCAVFFSRDRHDIISKASDLEQILGIKFFHPDDDWDQFLEFIKS
jgi:hypothetical protein